MALPSPLALPQVKGEWQLPALWPISISIAIAIGISICVTIGVPSAIRIIISITPSQVKG